MPPTPRDTSADARRAAAAAFEPAAFSEPIPQEKEPAKKAGDKLYFEPKYGDPAYGYFRNGTPYPDPFPCEPPTEQESLALNLTPAQRIAIDLLLLGSQLSVVAKRAGVTRMTLYRWLNHDANFQAAYHTWQADAIINTRTRLLSMASSAATTVECAVQNQPKIALAFLKATGMLQPATAGPTEPEECQQQIDLKAKQAQSQLQPLPQPLPRSESAVPHASVGKGVFAAHPTADALPALDSAKPTSESALQAAQIDREEQASPPSQTTIAPSAGSLPANPPAIILQPSERNDPRDEAAQTLTGDPSNGERASQLSHDVTFCNIS